MKKVYIFFGNGYEEIEALTVVDLLRRANIEVEMVSITDETEVTGAHGITVKMDMKFTDISEEDILSTNMLVLPGGVPGTSNLKNHKGLGSLILRFNNEQKYIAAICAAPTILGDLGIIKDKIATCYPVFSEEIQAKEYVDEAVVVADNIITSAGVGTAIPFGLKIIEILIDEVTATQMASTIVYK